MRLTPNPAASTCLIRKQASKSAHLGCHAGRCLDFHCPVPRQHLKAKIGDPRPTAPRTALARLHQGGGETPVHRVDQPPGATIRHPHLACRRRNGSRASQRIEQVSLARPDRDFGTQQNPDFGFDPFFQNQLPSTRYVLQDITRRIDWQGRGRQYAISEWGLHRAGGQANRMWRTAGPA
jgi:hypothetical protein